VLITISQREFRVRNQGIVSVAASTGNADRYRPCVECVLSTHAWKAGDCSGAESQCEQKAGDSTHRKYSDASNVPRAQSRKNTQIREACRHRACDLPMRNAVACKRHGARGPRGWGSSADNGGRSGPLGQGVSPLCVKGSPLVPQKFRGELFTLTPPNCACYFFGMGNCHHALDSPYSLELAHPPLRTKTIFDETKLRLDPRRPKTTTYGINSRFSALSADPELRHFESLSSPRQRAPRDFDSLKREAAGPEQTRRIRSINSSPELSC
jgi:hypothetical protein